MVTHDTNCHTQLCSSIGLIIELININRKNNPKPPKNIPFQALSESIPTSNSQLYVLRTEKTQLKPADLAGNSSLSSFIAIFLFRLSRPCAFNCRESFFAAFW